MAGKHGDGVYQSIPQVLQFASTFDKALARHVHRPSGLPVNEDRSIAGLDQFDAKTGFAPYSSRITMPDIHAAPQPDQHQPLRAKTQMPQQFSTGSNALTGSPVCASAFNRVQTKVTVRNILEQMFHSCNLPVRAVQNDQQTPLYSSRRCWRRTRS